MAASAQTEEPYVPAPHQFVAPKLPQPKQWHSPAVQRSMVGGLWMTDANYRSALYLKNDVETSTLTVTPVIYLANGAKYTLPQVRLDPAGTAVVDINGALGQLGIASWANLSGYVEVEYAWPWDGLCATIRNVDPVHSEQFNFGLAPSPENPVGKHAPPLATTFEGLWWKQEPNVTGFVAVSNLSSEPKAVTIQVTGRTGSPLAEHAVLVSPHGTKLIDLDELASAGATDGGLHVSWTGKPGEVLVNGGLEDQATGYSANIPFTSLLPDSATAISRRYAEIGLMTGLADPMMRFPADTVFTPYSVLRNVSHQAISVTPRLYWMQAGAARSAKLAPVTVAPLDSYTLDLPRALQLAGVGNYSGAINVILDVQGPLHALLAASGSVDKKSTYVFGVAPSAVIESAAKSLSYWSTANGDDTMVTLWNPADEAQDFLVTLFFAGGQYTLPLHLEGKVTRSFNISEIISNQIPDQQGRTIPLSVQEGSAIISGSQGESEQILLALDAGTYNVQKATCGTFCKTCVGATEEFIGADPWGAPVSGSVQETATAQYNTGSQFNRTSVASWSSGNTSIATVSAGKVTAHVAGSTNVLSNDPNIPDYSSGCYSYSIECPLYTGEEAQAPGDAVQVSVTGASVISNQVDSSLAPSSLSGAFSLWLQGGSGADWYLQEATNRSGGSHTDGFAFSTSTPASSYDAIWASWSVPDVQVVNSYSFAVTSLGDTHHSQYNTPYESQCGGGARAVYIITNLATCYGSVVGGSLNSNFATQTYVNGTGVSSSYGTIKGIAATSCSGATAGKPAGANSQNTFVEVSSITGACNSVPNAATVAAYDHVCGQTIFIANYGSPGTVKTVVDECPACGSDSPHFDNYSNSQGCSAHSIGDLPPTGYFETVQNPH